MLWFNQLRFWRKSSRPLGRFKTPRRWRSLIWSVGLLLGLTLALGASAPAVRAVDKAAHPLVVSVDHAPYQQLEQGIQHYEAGQFVEAIATWQQAATRFAQQGEALQQAFSLSNLSLAHQQLGQWDAARQTLSQSFDLLKPLAATAPPLEYAAVSAKATNAQGYLHWHQGQLEDALTSWREATAAYQAAQDLTGVVHSQLNQAQVLQALGLNLEGVRVLDQTYDRLQDAPTRIKALNLVHLGDALRRIGNLERSQQVLQESFAIAPDDTLKSRAQLALADTERALSHQEVAIGEQASAEAHVATALALYETVAREAETYRLQAQLNQLNYLIELGRFSKAAQVLPALALPVQQLTPNRDGVYSRLNYAYNVACLKAYQTSQTRQCVKREWQTRTAEAPLVEPLPTWKTIGEDLAIAVTQSRDLGDEIAESYAVGALAHLYELTNQWTPAQNLTQSALLLLEGKQAEDIAYRWEWQLGRIYQQQAQVTADERLRQQAREAYQRAIADLDEVRDNLLAIDPQIQFSFRDNVEPVYREFATLLLSHHAQGAAPGQADLKLAIQSLDALQLSELENFLGCRLSQLVRIDDATLDPTAAKLYPIILPDRLSIILELPGQPLVYRETRVAAAEVNRVLQALRAALVEPGKTPEVLTLAQQVYNWLIVPIEAELVKTPVVETLVFVPDGLLRNLPMGVLYDGSQYLIEKDYAIAVAPRLELFHPQSSDKPLSVLAGGIGLPQTLRGRQFPPILQLEEELLQIPEPLRSGTLLVNEAFTRSNLEQALDAGEFSAIHWKTHGTYSSDPAETYLIAYQDEITANELDELLQTYRREQSSTLDLLVLSACETARGDQRAVLGLAGVAARAGARTVLSTLWRADDAANTLLTNRFYDGLMQPGVTKAQALQEAQLALLNEYGYAAPFYWATYLLVGNWL